MLQVREIRLSLGPACITAAAGLRRLQANRSIVGRPVTQPYTR